MCVPVTAWLLLVSTSWWVIPNFRVNAPLLVDSKYNISSVFQQVLAPLQPRAVLRLHTTPSVVHTFSPSLKVWRRSRIEQPKRRKEKMPNCWHVKIQIAPGGPARSSNLINRNHTESIPSLFLYTVSFVQAPRHPTFDLLSISSESIH
ncbi:hypothetical protein EV363DRAFT_669551 [Boletus edulis]|nr:hypothetical protein EV363DRAFT_669551 [Boletus edulis]